MPFSSLNGLLADYTLELGVLREEYIGTALRCVVSLLCIDAFGFLFLHIYLSGGSAFLISLGVLRQRFPCTMFTLQTSFKPLSVGGGGVKYFCPTNVQEFGLCGDAHRLQLKVQ